MAQDNNVKKKLTHAADIGFGIGQNKYSECPCFSGSLKYDLIFGKNFIAAGYNGFTELEISIFGEPIEPDQLDELSITFNRKIVARPVVIYLGAGAGYAITHFNKEHITGQPGDWNEQVVAHNASFPLDLFVLFPPKGKVKGGLLFHLSYNKFVTYYSLSIVGHFEFGKARKADSKSKTVQ